MAASFWAGKTVLITGGTGSFGRAFARGLLATHDVEALRVLSRDEHKQQRLAEMVPDDRIRFFVGDVRDLKRLERAFSGADVVVHAAALKQVPACEYNPLEAIKTNIIGAANVIDAALDNDVEHVMGISTDKAANPVNLYGATKLCAEKLLIQGNSYVGEGSTRISCARYGNVLGSRGSVLPLFLAQRGSGRLTITDKRMTRFLLSVEEAVTFVIDRIPEMLGGEVFVPKIPSSSVVQLADVVAPNCEQVEIGIRPGEKLHEVLVTEEEGLHTKELDSFYVIEPEHKWWSAEAWKDGSGMPAGFKFTSENNPDRLSVQDLKQLVDGYDLTAHE